MVWLLILRSVEYVLRCASCEFEVFISKGALPLYQQIGKKYAELNQGNLPREEFDDFVSELELPELEDLFAQAETWRCSCSEENPTNFSNCWSCGAAAPIQPSSEEIEDMRGEDARSQY